MAGDLTLHGNREKVLLIRQEDNSIIKARLNLSSNSILDSKYFYIRSGDVIYIETRRSTKWNIVSTPISFTASVITTTLLILNYFNIY